MTEDLDCLILKDTLENLTYKYLGQCEVAINKGFISRDDKADLLEELSSLSGLVDNIRYILDERKR